MLFFRGHPVRVRQVVANAVTAAGIRTGWQNIPVQDSGSLEIGFFQMRPVHIHFERLGDTLWRIQGPENPYPIIHGWAHAYPSWLSLLQSVSGITVLNSDA
jgi:hypothetical protein